MYLLTMWLVEVGVAINIWTHHFTRYLMIKPCRWHREWDNLCTYHFHTNVCVFWSTRNPYDNLLQKKKIHMIRTSLYIYVIKCMALKRVINLFDCFKFFFLSLFFTFHFHLKPVQLPQILEDLTKLASD